MKFRNLALLGIGFFWIDAMHNLSRADYCGQYREALELAAGEKQRGVPDYSVGGSLVDVWRDDIAYIFSSSSGPDLDLWIDGRVSDCRDKTPLGPPDQVAMQLASSLENGIDIALDVLSEADDHRDMSATDASREEANVLLAKIADEFVRYVRQLRASYTHVRSYPQGLHNIDLGYLASTSESVAGRLERLVKLIDGSEYEEAMRYYANSSRRNAARLRDLETTLDTNNN